jgi:hypothetical protein
MQTEIYIYHDYSEYSGSKKELAINPTLIIEQLVLTLEADWSR